MKKHTPGEWEVVCNDETGAGTYIQPVHEIHNDGEIIADFYGPDAEANATLCSVAPDLLHELKMTHAALMISNIGHYADSPQCERTKAAIAKATKELTPNDQP